MSRQGHDAARNALRSERAAQAADRESDGYLRRDEVPIGSVKRRLPYRPPNDTSEAARARATAAWGFDPGRPVLSRWLWVFVVKAR